MEITLQIPEKKFLINTISSRIASRVNNADLKNRYIKKINNEEIELKNLLKSNLLSFKIDKIQKKIIQSCCNEELSLHRSFSNKLFTFKNPMDFFTLRKNYSVEIDTIDLVTSILNKINKKKRRTELNEFHQKCNQIRNCKIACIYLDDYIQDRIEKILFFDAKRFQVLHLLLTSEFSETNFKFLKTDKTYVDYKKRQADRCCSPDDIPEILKKYPKTQYANGMKEFLYKILT